jgi:acetyl esterase/lipase
MSTIHHPIVLLDRAAMIAMRVMVRSMKGSVTGPDAREPFDKLMEKVPAAEGVRYEQGEVGGVPGWWCRPNDAVANAALLYFHGGAYVVGSAQAYCHFVGQIASRAKLAAFVPEYARAPERPFPAAIDDATACYKGLVADDFTSIALAGDSAGGGLALALLEIFAAKTSGPFKQRPVCAAVMSPWTDLALTATTMETRAEADPLSTRDALAATARLYLGDHDSRDPRASPLYGDFVGQPPVRIHVGEDEILLDDSIRYGEQLERAGGTCQVHTWQGMVHVFPSNITLLHAAKAALDDIGDFLREQLVNEPANNLERLPA